MATSEEKLKESQTKIKKYLQRGHLKRETKS